MLRCIHQCILRNNDVYICVKKNMHIERKKNHTNSEKISMYT